VIQDDRFDVTESVTICAFTTDPTEAPLFRLRVEPGTANGLREERSLMVDKITTVHRSRLANRVGLLGDEDLIRLGRAIVVFFGLAGA
jgi:mRNA interferase MazF